MSDGVVGCCTKYTQILTTQFICWYLLFVIHILLQRFCCERLLSIFFNVEMMMHNLRSRYFLSPPLSLFLFWNISAFKQHRSQMKLDKVRINRVLSRIANRDMQTKKSIFVFRLKLTLSWAYDCCFSVGFSHLFSSFSLEMSLFSMTFIQTQFMCTYIWFSSLFF